MNTSATNTSATQPQPASLVGKTVIHPRSGVTMRVKQVCAHQPETHVVISTIYLGREYKHACVSAAEVLRDWQPQE